MKTNILKYALLALASLAFVSTPAQAQLVYNAGDLFLGFRIDGGTDTDVIMVNIGQGSSFAANPPGNSFNLAIGAISTDLASKFGASWFTRTDLWWGVAGAYAVAGSDPIRTLYATSTDGLGFNRASNGIQGAPANQTGTSLGGAYTAGVQGSNLAVSSMSNSDTNNWASLVTNGVPTQTFSGNSFGYYPTGVEKNQISTSTLDLFRMQVGSGPGTYEGTFSINGSGVVSFNTIPEPSTYALIGLGLGGLALLRRFNTKKAIKA